MQRSLEIAAGLIWEGEEGLAAEVEDAALCERA